jgi:HEAT repeat protein
MNTKARTILGCIVGCAAVTLAGFRLAGSGLWPHGSSASAKLAPAWKAGRVYRYQVAWTQDSLAVRNGEAAQGLPDRLEAKVALDAVIRVEPTRTDAQQQTLELTIESVRSAQVQALGTDLLADEATRAATLAPRMVEAVYDARGALQHLRLPKDTPELTAGLLEGIALELQGANAAPGVVEERASEGVFRVEYRSSSDGNGLERVRTEAVSLAGIEPACVEPCKITLKGNGSMRFASAASAERHPTRVEDHERVLAQESGHQPRLQSSLAFEAELIRVSDASDEARAPLAQAELATKEPGAPWESSQSAQRLLEHRALGMTNEGILSGLELAGAIGPEGLPGGWLASATAFLELHPEFLAEIGARFQNPDLSQQAKVTILDVLAATGTPEAQKLLRELLGGAAANDDPAQRLALVQRLMLLEKPEPETVAFLRQRFEQSRAQGDGEMELAAAHTLGATLAHSDSDEARAEADKGASSLRLALSDARGPSERAGLLRALGNAGANEAVATIAAAARDEDERVRAAAAAALRKTPTSQAQTALVSLASDTSETVQLAALDSLGEQPLSDGVLGQLSKLLPDSTLGGQAEAELVTLFSRQPTLTPAMRSALETVLARTEDNRLRARVRAMLGGLPPL